MTERGEVMEQQSLDLFEKVFWHLSRKMEHVWAAIYEETFPSSQSQMMYLIDQRGPQKMSELAKSLHITAGAVTTASTILIEKGYLTRLHNEQDRRVIRLDLTDKGKQQLTLLQDKGRQAMREIFQDISDEQLDKMTKIFEKAYVRIDEHLYK